jgi:hypothetical protein
MHEEATNVNEILVYTVQGKVELGDQIREDNIILKLVIEEKGIRM